MLYSEKVLSWENMQTLTITTLLMACQKGLIIEGLFEKQVWFTKKQKFQFWQVKQSLPNCIVLSHNILLLIKLHIFTITILRNLSTKWEAYEINIKQDYFHSLTAISNKYLKVQELIILYETLTSYEEIFLGNKSLSQLFKRKFRIY